MNTQEKRNKTVARGYGELDAIYNIGYYPRPKGYEKEYNDGYRSKSPTRAIEGPLRVSYQSRVNSNNQNQNKRKNMKTQYIPFETANDTDQWVLAVDDHMMLTDEKTAKESYKSIGDIHESFFGCAQIIAPMSNFGNCLGEKYRVFASQCQQSDVIGYMLKRGQRLEAKMQGQDSLSETALDALNRAKQWRDLFLTDIVISEIARTR